MDNRAGLKEAGYTHSFLNALIRACRTSAPEAPHIVLDQHGQLGTQQVGTAEPTGRFAEGEVHLDEQCGADRFRQFDYLYIAAEARVGLGWAARPCRRRG